MHFNVFVYCQIKFRCILHGTYNNSFSYSEIFKDYKNGFVLQALIKFYERHTLKYSHITSEWGKEKQDCTIMQRFIVYFEVNSLVVSHFWILLDFVQFNGAQFSLTRNSFYNVWATGYNIPIPFVFLRMSIQRINLTVGEHPRYTFHNRKDRKG